MPYKLKHFGGGVKVVSPNHPHGFSKKPQMAAMAKKQLAAIQINAPAEKEGSFASKFKLRK